jgi:ABC-type transporter Mla subunit MlaD
MTITEEDFSRLFSLVSSLADVTQENTEDITMLESSAQSLFNTATAHQQDQQHFNAVLTEIQRQGDEIRGLQTENRRILDILINRNENQ